MIILDKALHKLEKENKPIRVGLVGAGFAGRGLAIQFLEGIPGMRLAAVSNRTLSYAQQTYSESNIRDATEVGTQEDLDKAIKENKYIYTSNSRLITRSPEIDVIVEATGEVEFGAGVVMDAINNKKHIVLINAELDTTLGPILKKYADKAEVIYTQADGDQPGKLMNLSRQVALLGFKPMLLGNIKSLLDPYRTPDTQKGFAQAHFQRPKMVTSFADGTKISFEMASLANATGFRVGKRGMYGPACKRVEEALDLYSYEELKNGGLVDYIQGAEPSFGVFVLAESTNPIKRRYMDVYKMGDGPLYLFYDHCHLSPLESPRSIAAAAIFGDATLAPIIPVCDVLTLAKQDLRARDVLDGIGGFTCYGVIENVQVMQKQNLLPMGLSDRCVLLKDIQKDEPITFSDVTLPTDRLCDQLYKEQLMYEF